MASSRSPWSTLPLLALGLAALYACTPSSQGPPDWSTGGFASTSSGSGGDTWIDAGSSGGPPPVDAGGVCGNEVHKSSIDPPNVYFVFDASGSMAEGVPGAGGTRYQVLQKVAAKIVDQLQHLIRPGAAVFPAAGQGECAPGGEIYPVTYGDPKGFASATAAIKPNGGTPTAMTLMALVPKLKSLTGKTVVVLATDGAPNCNAAASCDISECMENIEGCQKGHTCCVNQQNCCDSSVQNGPLNCVDRAQAVAAVQAVRSLGVKVYVVGIPGSQHYEQVLREMALAGGAAQPASPFYYKVDDGLTTLGDVLSSAAGGVIPCQIALADPPTDPDLTNVYFDQAVVDFDAANGWGWHDATHAQVDLHGAACDQLHSGKVGQVQIVSGCPTQVPQ